MYKYSLADVNTKQFWNSANGRIGFAGQGEPIKCSLSCFQCSMAKWEGESDWRPGATRTELLVLPTSLCIRPLHALIWVLPQQQQNKSQGQQIHIRPALASKDTVLSSFDLRILMRTDNDKEYRHTSQHRHFNKRNPLTPRKLATLLFPEAQNSSRLNNITSS